MSSNVVLYWSGNTKFDNNTEKVQQNPIVANYDFTITCVWTNYNIIN